jgi:hypothetical protein
VEKIVRLKELLEQYKDAEIWNDDSEELQKEYVKEIEEYIGNLIKKLS